MGIKQFVSCILFLTFKDCSVEYIGELTLTFTRLKQKPLLTEETLGRLTRMKSTDLLQKKNLSRMRNRKNEAWFVRHHEQIRENLFLF